MPVLGIPAAGVALVLGVVTGAVVIGVVSAVLVGATVSGGAVVVTTAA